MRVDREIEEESNVGRGGDIKSTEWVRNVGMGGENKIQDIVS